MCTVEPPPLPPKKGGQGQISSYKITKHFRVQSLQWWGICRFRNRGTGPSVTYLVKPCLRVALVVWVAAQPIIISNMCQASLTYGCRPGFINPPCQPTIVPTEFVAAPWISGACTVNWCYTLFQISFFHGKMLGTLPILLHPILWWGEKNAAQWVRQFTASVV